MQFHEENPNIYLTYFTIIVVHLKTRSFFFVGQEITKISMCKHVSKFLFETDNMISLAAFCKGKIKSNNNVALCSNYEVVNL